MAIKPRRSRTNQPNNSEELIRKRITARFNARAEFFGHLAGFLASGAGLFIFSGTIQANIPWLMSICTVGMMLWGIGLVIHFANFVMAEMRESAIERAIERERQLRGTSYEEAVELFEEKPKRERLRLTDDGELEPIDEENDESDQPITRLRDKKG